MKKYIVIIVVLALLLTGYVFYKKNQPSQEVISFSDDLYLIVEDILIEDGMPVLYEDGTIYFSFDIIKMYIDEFVFYDEEEELVIFTNSDKVKRFKLDEKTATVNSKEFFIHNPIRKLDDKIYIPIELFVEDYEVEIHYYEDTNAMVMDYTDIHYLTGEIVLDGGSIRTDLDIKAPIVNNNLEIGQLLYVYGEFEKWYKVRTIDGVIGFIDKKYVKLNHTKDIYKTQLKEREKDRDYGSKKINLTWDYTYGKVKNTDNIVSIPGVNVISPTWFSILDEEGNIFDKGNKDYVKKYKELGYEIWPLIDNNFNPDLTHEILVKSSMREKIIDDLLDLYLDYGFTGINIDFENVYLKDKDLLTQFTRELYPVFNSHDLTVSMDVTGISTSENWSMSFDREKLHQSTDYLILMAYDQHWASSPIAGSVAQYEWVENSLIRIFDMIPKDKLILAVPFYTRLWIEEDGKISSQAITMEKANEFIRENNIDLVWDSISAQFYGEIEKDQKVYKIWLEDEKSLEHKVSLIHKYNLAGLASWRKGFESSNIWTSLDRILN